MATDEIKEALAIDAEARRIGAAAESARIRRELEASIDALQPASLDNVALFNSIRRQLLRDLDHICPEEK